MKLTLLLLSGLLLMQNLASAESTSAAQEPTDFVRFKEDARGAQLQTSIASYRNAQGVIVDLIGAIHVADKAYYEKLNARFPQYDALLYEMVGGPIQSREERMKGDDLATEENAAAQRLSWLQTLFETLQSSLMLESQLTGIDYHKPNFVHADMTLKQFSDMQTDRNEGFLSLWWKAVKAQMDQPETTAKQPGVLEIMEILMRKDSPVELKRLIGRTFDSVEMLMTGMESGEGTVIVSERNKVALGVLKQQMAAGRKRLGIFYGAAHLPDLEKRLQTLGFQRQNVEWFDAWSLPPPPVLEKSPGKEAQKKSPPSPAGPPLPAPLKS